MKISLNIRDFPDAVKINDDVKLFATYSKGSRYCSGKTKEQYEEDTHVEEWQHPKFARRYSIDFPFGSGPAVGEVFDTVLVYKKSGIILMLQEIELSPAYQELEAILLSL